jgi:hypothetical protein
MMLSYAGYKQMDGSVIGDPSNVEITEVINDTSNMLETGSFPFICTLVACIYVGTRS